MDELEQIIEFRSMLEAWEMPSHLKTAIMEAFEFHHGNIYQQLPRMIRNKIEHYVDPLPDDIKADIESLPVDLLMSITQLPLGVWEEIKRMVDQQESMTMAMRMKFNRPRAVADIVKDALRNPRRYNNTPEQAEAARKRAAFHKATLGQQMRDSGLDTMPASQARKKYYQAAVDVVSRIFSKYGIPFDAEGYLKEMYLDDRQAINCTISRADAANLKFNSFREANENKSLNSLKIVNNTLHKVMQACYWLLKGLSEAEYYDMVDRYLEDQRMRLSYLAEAPHQEVKPKVARLTDEDQAAYDRQQAKIKEQQSLADVSHKAAYKASSIADLRNGKFSAMPYEALYKKFAECATADKLALTPKPDESIADYFDRIDHGNIPADAFTSIVANNVKTAYPNIDINQVLNTYYKERDFKDCCDGITKKSKIINSIRPELIPYFCIWYTLDYMKNARNVSDDTRFAWQDMLDDIKSDEKQDDAEARLKRLLADI